MRPFWRQGSEFLQRSPTEEKSLLPDVGEAHGRLCLVALPLDVDDHSFAPFGVTDVITDAQAEHLSPVFHRSLRPERPLHDLITVAVHRRAPAAGAERAPLPCA